MGKQLWCYCLSHFSGFNFHFFLDSQFHPLVLWLYRSSWSGSLVPLNLLFVFARGTVTAVLIFHVSDFVYLDWLKCRPVERCRIVWKRKREGNIEMVIICRVTCCCQALKRVRLQQIQTWGVKAFNFFLVKHKNTSRRNRNPNHWEHKDENTRTLTQTGRREGLKYTKKGRRQSDTGERHSGHQAGKQRSKQACWDGRVSQKLNT